MKTMTANDFQTFLKSGWTLTETIDPTHFQYDDANGEATDKYQARSTVEATKDGVIIRTQNLWDWVVGGDASFIDDANEGIDLNEQWAIDGVKVVDENGDALDLREIVELIRDAGRYDYFFEPDMSGFTYGQDLLIAKAAAILSKTDKEECVQISSGTHIQTRASIQAEVECWDDEDEFKGFDFSTAPYWLTFGNDVEPKGVYGADDEDFLAILKPQQPC